MHPLEIRGGFGKSPHACLHMDLAPSSEGALLDGLLAKLLALTDAPVPYLTQAAHPLHAVAEFLRDFVEPHAQAGASLQAIATPDQRIRMAAAPILKNRQGMARDTGGLRTHGKPSRSTFHSRSLSRRSAQQYRAHGEIARGAMWPTPMQSRSRQTIAKGSFPQPGRSTAACSAQSMRRC